MATARFRKTFKYPTDTDSEDDGPEAMDEDEQDHLIQTMQQDNATRNAQYSLLLLAISLLSTLPYIRTLFTPHTALLSLLSITSLLSTAYLIHILPPHITGLQYLDKLNSSSSSSSAPRSLASRKAAMLQAGGGGGPVEKYLPLLNCGLCVVLVGLGGVVGRRLEAGGSGSGLWWGFEWLPAGVWGVTVLAKWVMGGVDPEGELGSLRYELKGA
ncbi:hypothetical protein ONS95_003989 [Cadophora gregata]|uniref:uncharacterized protein n=1 Tax=Cadophora gregata TaxID=51156 RepID=UPI0026DAAD59|nr:uncharacterized protein ONS95_003989 [Cadophora gregata]KAK0107291.1 hypothetical protein ONS95_003989 [Cadophora gregata]KAK0116973.1 hypothetical protein ONS96_012816 [Cadophora gregata f. sp. sojae]